MSPLLSLAASLLMIASPPVRSFEQWTFRSTVSSNPALPLAHQDQPAMRLTAHYLVLGDLAQVLDRATGKVVWQRNGDASPFPTTVSGDLKACWRGDLALVESAEALTGIDLRTGSLAWSISKGALPARTTFLIVYGSVVAMAPFEGMSSNTMHALLFDVVSGRHLDPHVATDRLVLKRSADEYGSPVAAPRYYPPSVLDLVSGEMRAVPSLTSMQYRVNPVATVDRQILCYVDTDDDFAGHSVWPKYLVSYDIRGRRVWQFPKRITQGDNQMGTGASFQEVPVWVPQAHCLITISKAGLYGVSARDGHPLWHSRQWTHWVDRCEACGKGVLLDVSNDALQPGMGRIVGPKALYYLDAATGATHRLADGLPPEKALAADEDQVFVLDFQGTVHTYRLRRAGALTKAASHASHPSLRNHGASKLIPGSTHKSRLTQRTSSRLAKSHAFKRDGATKASQLPSPLLEADLSDCFSQGPVAEIVVNPLDEVLLVRQRGNLVALERATGRKLWSRPSHQKFDRFGKPMRGTPASESMEWSLIASNRVEDLGMVAIVQADKTTVQEDKSHNHGTRMVFSDRIEAIQAATGRILWQSDWREQPYAGYPSWRIGMVDNLLVELPDVDSSSLHNPFRLRSAATGNLLDPMEPADRAVIQRVVAHHGNKPVQITSGPVTGTIDLVAGTAAYTGLREGGEIVEPAVFPGQQRVVRYFRGDDDGVGHSNWPNYVTGNAPIGGSRWSLPRHVERPLPPEKFSSTRPQRIDRMVPCRDVGSVLCVGDDKWYGVDVTDGRILWTNATPLDWKCNVIEAEGGFLTAMEMHRCSPGRPGAWFTDYSLAWVDGRTGKFRWLAHTPFLPSKQDRAVSQRNQWIELIVIGGYDSSTYAPRKRNTECIWKREGMASLDPADIFPKESVHIRGSNHASNE